jgi:hypothetical protein
MPFVPVLDFDAYIQELDRHDWTFEYSDDHSVWKKGYANQDRLYGLTRISPRYAAAFKAYGDYYFNRNNMTRERLEKMIHDLRLERVYG